MIMMITAHTFGPPVSLMDLWRGLAQKGEEQKGEEEDDPGVRSPGARPHRGVSSFPPPLAACAVGLFLALSDPKRPPWPELVRSPAKQEPHLRP